MGLEVLLKNLIDTFYLTITLRMVTRGKVQGNFKGLAQCLLEFGNKLYSIIRNNVSWKTMEVS